MKNFFKVAVFSLLTIGFFSAFSSFGIPQIRPAPPPKPEALAIGTMTMEQFIALGEKVFAGKGTCPLCHNPVGGRAPLLDNVAKVVPERLADGRYKGTATDVESYLRESMIDPSAYVVAGFGKKGTGDAVSPMPNVSAASIGLSDVEREAVIAYLQQTSGVEVTVRIPKAVAANAASAETVAREPAKTSEQVIATFGCGACHKVASEQGEAGPDLRKIGAKRDKDYLRRAILDPNAEIAEGFQPDQMPADYGRQMFASELEILVDYLIGLK